MTRSFGPHFYKNLIDLFFRKVQLSLVRLPIPHLTPGKCADSIYHR